MEDRPAVKERDGFETLSKTIKRIKSEAVRRNRILSEAELIEAKSIPMTINKASRTAGYEANGMV